MKEMQRQQAEKEQARQLMRQAYQTPVEQALLYHGGRAGFGPTPQAAAALPLMQGGFNPALMREKALQAGNPYAVELAESFRKSRDLKTMKPGESLWDVTNPTAPKQLIKGLSDEWELSPTQNFPGQQLYIHKVTKEPKLIGSRPPVTNINIGGNEDAFTKEIQIQQAREFSAAQADAADAQRGNNSLARIKGIIAQGGVTSGPIAPAVVTARNILSELNIPLDKGLDDRNARLSAETSTRIAEKLLKGGKAVTDSDIKRIAKAFPGFESGIPAAQLPAFIAQIEAINNERIATFTEMRGNINPEVLKKMPMTFSNTPAAARAAAQPNPAPTQQSSGKTVDQIMQEFFPTLTVR
jgi:hypothetical protein